ncbi:MAG: GtrA family protein [Clostridia bacterium]|nr:GtrA family protein [Clostridia bacterium]
MYIIFGVLTTLVSWCSYIIFVNTFFMSVLLSSALSWVCGVVFAFVTNKIWVFESKSFKPLVLLKEGIGFVSSRVITGVLEVFGVPLLSSFGFDNLFFSLAENIGLKMSVFYTDGIYSKVIFAVIVIILNYVFSKLIVFKTKK